MRRDSTVKIILREGGAKLAVRGELEMFQPGGQSAIEGKRQDDKALQAAGAAHRNHLNGIWKAVARLPKPD